MTDMSNRIIYRNQQGPAGPKGATGAQGDQGPQGDPGLTAVPLTEAEYDALSAAEQEDATKLYIIVDAS